MKPPLDILIDTREQEPLTFAPHIVEGGKPGRLIHETRIALPTGDYSIKGHSGRDDEPAGIAIERKANWDELANNFTADRERWEACCERLSKFRQCAIVLCDDYWGYPRNSSMSPRILRANLEAWSMKFRIPVFFAGNRLNAATLVADCLRRYAEMVEKEAKEK